MVVLERRYCLASMASKYFCCDDTSRNLYKILDYYCTEITSLQEKEEK